MEGVMRISTYFKHDARTGQYRVTRVECDVCPDTMEYEGHPHEAVKRLLANLWTIGNTGVVRCKICAHNFAFTLSHSIERRPP